MAGNRQIYEQAMSMGHSAAWDQQWDKAIAAYGRAVQEFPEDPTAHNSLGLALLQARRLEDALKVYTRAHQLAPDDPIPLEKSADVLERLGRLKEAAQQYVNAAEVYLAARDPDKAIGNWERATRLAPGLVKIHQQLALAYERTGQRKSAIREFLTLAFNFQKANRTDIAIQAVERALRIDPTSPQALNTLQALQSGVLISADLLTDEEADQQQQQAADRKAFDKKATTDDDADQRAVGEADPRGPLGDAIETALAELASYVFESGMLDAGGTYAIQGIELQRQGDYGAAAGVYEKAISNNMRHSAVYLNLGAMLLEQQDWKNAAKNLEKATGSPTLAAGALHGMTLAYAAMKNHRSASRNLVQTLRAVDVGLAINSDEAGQLSAIYDQLAANVDQADEIQLQTMNERFLVQLTGPTWKQRVTKLRRLVEEAVHQGSLVDIVPPDDRAVEGMRLVDQYMRQGMYNLAMDQAHYILEAAPDYLPVHQQIGQILLERDNIAAAMAKYNLVANTYIVRGDVERGAEILQEALKIAPMDIGLHKSLIEQYEKAENWEKVLLQQIDMADAYYQLADLDSARSTYTSALTLAQRINAPKEMLVQILHRIADIDVSRLDLRQAMRTYEQIRKIEPEDERARRALVDLNYRMNDPVSAIRELDGLLRLYAKQRKANKIIQILDEHVTRYPKDMALRSRLAAVYDQTGMKDKAVQQLDQLAELQLQAGLSNDAIVTVRRIIGMNPPNVQDYTQLLKQLGG